MADAWNATRNGHIDCPGGGQRGVEIIEASAVIECRIEMDAIAYQPLGR